MSLITFDETQSNVQFKKLELLKLVNLHVVRVLSTKGHKTYVHWINRVPIECLDKECPICDSNTIIRAENPNTFYNIEGYYRRQQVFYLNVMDRTLTKICPNCEYENTAIGNRFTPTCENCGNLIGDVKANPINKIKVLSRGKVFGDELNNIHSNNVDSEGNPIGIQNYDIQIMVDARKQPFAQALLDSNDVVEFSEDELFNLKTAPIQLEADEILEFKRGIALRDIFAARNKDDDMEFPPTETPLDNLEGDLMDEIDSKVQDLIG